ncbi:hypothetical protein ABH942_003008 [Flavobacterium sp. 28YEA47A]|uniref:hypothetical protein n=1 Tax=Flavobacterium sp. 28YEA47A TaxID=3156276 RepID=UPI003513E14B
MTTEEFKKDYYLEKIYERISEIEFDCKLIVKRKSDNAYVTGVKTKTNILDVSQDITDTRFAINPITWPIYLDDIIIMLFNLLIFRISLTDIYETNNKRNIADFFRINPFYED